METLTKRQCSTKKGNVYVLVDHEKDGKNIIFHFQKKSAYEAGTDEDALEILEELTDQVAEFVSGMSYSYDYGYEQEFESGIVTPSCGGYDLEQGIEDALDRAEDYLFENF